MGKLLIISGLAIAVVGLIVLAAGRIPWLGHLPGDITIRRQGFTFYLPVTTCLVLSAALSVLLYIFRR